MQLIPTYGRLIVKEIEQNISSVIQIVRTETSAEKFVRGEVIEASKGFFSLTGTWIDSAISKGDIIWYNRFNGAEIKINRKDYVLLDEKEVLLVERADESGLEG